MKKSATTKIPHDANYHAAKKLRRQRQLQGLKFLFSFLKTFKKESLTILFLSLSFTTLNFSISITFFYFLNWVSGTFISDVSNNTVLFVVYGVLFILGYLIALIFSQAENHLIAKTAQAIGHHIRRDTFKKIQLLRIIYFDTNPSGDILSRVSNDANKMINVLTQNTAEILTQSLMFVSVIIAMFVFSPLISTIIVLGIFPITFVFIIVLTKFSQKYFKTRQAKLGALNGYIEEIISNIRSVKSFSYEEVSEAKFEEKMLDYARNDYKAYYISRTLFPTSLFLSDIANSIALAVPVIFIINNIEWGGITSTLNANGTSNFAVSISLITVYTMFLRFYNQGLFSFTNLSTNIQTALAGAGRIAEVHLEKEEKLASETLKVDSLKGKVNIKNFSFKYPHTENKILRNINLTAKPGDVIAIVGPTGSGKTSLINILCKFYEYEEGEIRLDDHDLRSFDKQNLRKHVAIVLQDTVLFNDTLLENIRFGNLSATDEEVYEAARKANAHHFISCLDKGYQTVLNETSTQLSIGEKQLISIARAFLRRASILILDEATSNIDSKTEKDIQSAMLKLMENRTTFIIAHRLSTIKSADKIAVLNFGDLEEVGNHEELLAKKGMYYKMYTEGSRRFGHGLDES